MKKTICILDLICIFELQNSCKDNLQQYILNNRDYSLRATRPKGLLKLRLRLFCNSKAVISHTKTLLMQNSKQIVSSIDTQYHNEQFFNAINDFFKTSLISETTKNNSFLLTHFLEEQEGYNNEVINDTVYLTTQLNDFLIELKEKFNNLTFKTV